MREFVLSTLVGQLGTTSGSVTLLFLRASGAPSMNIEVLRWWVGQSANATSAQQRIQYGWRGTGYPILGLLTASALKLQDPNATVLISSTVGSTAGITGANATSETSSGTATYGTGYNDDFNVLNGWLMVPTPPETMITPAGHNSGLALVFPVQPGSANTWGFGCIYREV